ncbi:RNA polymerase sigma factor [Lysinibacillus sphaericus]|uniref:RNA polymerase sigma factor SigX n=1 Tax=Lysinibacillus sphaericus OT4b.31 TaxID=1285586 RepID=R7ZCI4_LYSSH|nr:RNA polymerase sigma factor [Lysinibacillus sphaericus]EON71724.1 RNA polymerase sigma factor SigX [Lysinibacillus sphaericus OT4b.31]
MLQQFQQDYKMHSDAIYKYIYYLVGNKEMAEDLTQETFYKAFQYLHTYRQESNVHTWLRKIARNLVYDHFRRKKILRFIPFVHNECIRDETVLPEEFLIKGEDFSALFLALYKIKLEYREAIILRYLEELSVKDTAKLLGWSEAKVKNNTARGLQTLRKHLGEEGLTYE